MSSVTLSKLHNNVTKQRGHNGELDDITTRQGMRMRGVRVWERGHKDEGEDITARVRV